MPGGFGLVPVSGGGVRPSSHTRTLGFGSWREGFSPAVMDPEAALVWAQDSSTRDDPTRSGHPNPRRFWFRMVPTLIRPSEIRQPTLDQRTRIVHRRAAGGARPLGDQVPARGLAWVGEAGVFWARPRATRARSGPE